MQSHNYFAWQIGVSPSTTSTTSTTEQQTEPRHPIPNLKATSTENSKEENQKNVVAIVQNNARQEETMTATADSSIVAKMSPLNKDDDGVAAAVVLRSFKENTADICDTKLKAVSHAKKAQKKSQPKRITKRCMLRIRGKIDWTDENKIIVHPDVTCSKIVRGEKVINCGNVICNSCGKCFCAPIVKRITMKSAVNRNCFEKHKELEGSSCKDATYTALSQITPRLKSLTSKYV